MSAAHPPASAEHGRRPRASALPVLVAALASGVAGYVVLVLAARVLDPADNARFLVFWGVLFGSFGVLIGVTTEVTRAVFASRWEPGGGRTAVMPVTVAGGALVALVIAVSGIWWSPALFGDEWLPLLVAAVVGVLLFVVHATLGGVAAGRADWSSYSTLVGIEAMVRLMLCAIAAVVGAHVVGLAWAVSLACGTWAALALVSGRCRTLWGVRVDLAGGRLARRLVAACTASGVSALLLVGYPVLLSATTPDDVYATAAPIVLAVSLSRAPLLVPLGAYQNVVVTRVAESGIRALVPVVGTLGALTAVGTVGAWLLGPWALRVVNPDYHVSGPVFAALMLAAGLVALLTVTGAAAIALDHHIVYLAGWIGATVAAAGVLLAPGSLEQRVLGSLLLCPLLGVAVHLVWGHRRIG